MTRKGIISDRCELNRQIRADNALLRELKAEIKKLAALVIRTVPAIAEGLEKLRSRVLIFCYQISHIRSGKAHVQKSLAVWKPELERYTGLVQQIKEKSKERKALVAEKKELPIYHVKRHKTLAVRIAELTEELEELRSEKAAERQLEETLQKKPSVGLLLNAKQETLRLLGENEEEWQARQLIAHKRQEQHRNSISKRKRSDPER